ncbi:MAG: ABC transporter substrate-binding protein [Parvibaculaceae bacterium]
MHDRAFQKDCLEILASKVARGELSRRRFTQIAAMLLAGAPFALRSRNAEAAANELVLVNWGGDAIKAYDTAYGQPFLKETGITVKEDGSGPTEGAVAAQFKSGKPTWDLVDIDPFSAITLGKQGMMEEIDYAVVDKSKMRPGFGWDHAASTYFFSYVLAYDAKKFGDKAPTGMADFFDVEKFPGKRSMYKWGSAMWEVALLGDGVAPDKLYPLDLDRAHAKIKAFKDNIVSFWGGGAESQSVLMNGDASMAIVWSTRAMLMEQDSGGGIKYIWDQGLLSPGALGVIKNNPGGKENAMKFIASAQAPEKQLVIFDMLAQGPANPATDALIPEDKRRHNCVDQANIAKQVPLDMPWYAEKYSAALDAYTAVISA